VNTPKRLTLSRWLRIFSIVLVAGCASNQVHNEAMRLLAEGQRDAAIAKLREASRMEPDNPQYRIELLNETQKYARELSERAEEARRTGNANEAAELFGKALRLDPANDRARRGLVALERDARSNKLLAESERALKEGYLQLAQERVDAALADNPANAGAQRHAAVIREHVCRQAVWLGIELDGTQRRALVADDGHTLHLALDGSTFTFTETSPWPQTDVSADPRRARAPVAGTVAQVLVRAGDTVAMGQPLVSVEAMKMEMWLNAAAAGTVRAVHAAPKAAVASGAVLVELDIPEQA